MDIDLLVVVPVIAMMQVASRATSRLLKGRTRTATFTEDILSFLSQVYKTEKKMVCSP